MPSHIALDDALIEQAVRLGKHKPKTVAVAASPEAHVRGLKRATRRDVIGTIDFHEDVDRRARPCRQTGRKR
jgi:hypothetical protein